MLRGLLLISFSLACADGRAAGLDAGKTSAEPMFTSAGGHFVRAASGGQPQALGFDPAAAGPQKRSADKLVSATPLARAIAGARKKDMLEQGVEASRDALLACQRETSAVLTTPLMRSDSQRDHCFRF